jgi:hypothetical protein
MEKKFVLKNKSVSQKEGKEMTTLYYNIYHIKDGKEYCIENYPIEFYDENNIFEFHKEDIHHKQNFYFPTLAEIRFKEEVNIRQLFEQQINNGQ